MLKCNFISAFGGAYILIIIKIIIKTVIQWLNNKTNAKNNITNEECNAQTEIAKDKTNSQNNINHVKCLNWQKYRIVFHVVFVIVYASSNEEIKFHLTFQSSFELPFWDN